jgi:hypothetical protein
VCKISHITMQNVTTSKHTLEQWFSLHEEESASYHVNLVVESMPALAQ